MKICKLCKSKMPDELFSPLFINGGYETGLCPICAMTRMNQVMGLPIGTPFQGEMASDLVDEAWQYYEPKGDDIYGVQDGKKI